MIGHGPSDDHAGAQADDGCQVHPSLAGAQIGDVPDQAGTRGLGGEDPAEKVLEDLLRSEGMVMRLKARIHLAAQPFSAMMASTVPTETSTPVEARFVWTMRWPKVPSEESSIALTSPVSCRCRAAVGDSSWPSHR